LADPFKLLSLVELLQRLARVATRRERHGLAYEFVATDA